METRFDVLIRGLYKIHNYEIIDIIFGDSDVDTYKHKPMGKLLVYWEKQNKNRHGKLLHEQHNRFIRLFFLLVAF